MVGLLFGVIIVGVFYYYCVKPLEYWKSRGVGQGNPKWLFGHYWENITGKRNGCETFQKVYKQSPNTRYTGIYRFTTPLLVITDPSLIKDVTIKDFDAFTDHTELVPVEKDTLWYKNLFTLKGSRWREMRTQLSPSFTSSKMRLLFEQMSLCAQNLLQHVLKNNEEVLTVELRDIFSRYTNDVIATTVFKVKVDSFANPNNEFYRMANEIANFSTVWKTFKLLLYWGVPVIEKFIEVRFLPEKPANYFRRIVEDLITTRDEKSTIKSDMLHLHLHAKKDDQIQKDGHKIESLDKDNPLRLTNEDITAHAIIFFIGGLESVTSTMCYTIYELAINPDIQSKLIKEVRGAVKDSGGIITYETIFNLRYLEMVISESLRKWPHLTVMNRVCTKSYTINPVLPGERPLRIDKGIDVVIPVYAIHRDPKYYPDPERFDPERFSEENKRYLHPNTFLPFGLGPRMCIGSRFALMEIKIMLFHLLSRFEIVPVKKTAVPLKFCKHTFLNLKPEGGFWLGLKRYKE